MEVLATGAASEPSLLIVGGEVKRQVGGGDECFGAEAAAVRFQADPPVWPSSIGDATALLAGGTFGWTFCFVHRLLVRRGRSVC